MSYTGNFSEWSTETLSFMISQSMRQKRYLESCLWQMVPWVPETFLAPFPVSLWPKMCQPLANTENSCRTREKPLVPRVGKWQT